MFTNTGREYIKLRSIGTSVSVANLISLGTGSASVSAGRISLVNEISGLRSTFRSAINGSAAYELSFGADFNSTQMSGLSLSEFQVLPSNNTAVWSDVTTPNYTFNSALTSGADWYQSGLTTRFSGAIITTISWDAGSGWRAQANSGAGYTIASGEGMQITELASFYPGAYLKFAYFLSAAWRPDDLVGEVRVGGSLIYTIPSGVVSTSGLVVTNLNNYSGVLSLTCGVYSNKTITSSGTCSVVYDFFNIGSYVGGSPYSLESFTPIQFTGNEELQLDVVWKVY